MADELVGNPPLTKFSPTLDTYPQNFDIAQGPDSTVYVGNTEGVMLFDGERWTLARLDNRDMVRSLAADEHGRIYVGGFNQFGYLERDETGFEVFHDLSALFSDLLEDDEEYFDIWDIEISEDGVFFAALRHLFLYSPEAGGVKLWRYEGRFGALSSWQDTVVLQFRGEGLYQYEEGDWRLLPGSESLTDMVVDFVQLEDGGLLGIGANGGWPLYHNGRVSEHAMPDGLPDASIFSEMIMPRPGTVALTTQDGRLFVVNLAQQSFRQHDLQAGYLSGLISARGGGLLAVDDVSLIHIAWPGEWSVLGSEQGMSKTAFNLRSYNDHWYVLSSAGAQIARNDEGSVSFSYTGWTSHEAWDLLDLGDGTALLADSYNLHQVQGDDDVIPVTDDLVYPRYLLRSRFDPNVVFTGTEGGLMTLRRSAGKGDWQVQMHAEDFGNPVILGIVEVSATELWLGSSRDGLIRVTLADDHRELDSVRFIDSADGVEYGDQKGAYVIQNPEGKLIVATERGFYCLEDGQFLEVDMDGLSSLKSPDEFLKLAYGPGGDQWAYSYNTVYYKPAGEDWEKLDIQIHLVGAIESLRFDESGNALFVASGRLLRFEELTEGGMSPPQVRFTEVVTARDDVESRRLPINTNNSLVLPATDFHLRIRFAYPEYSAENGVRYSTRVMGLEEYWSGWAESTVTDLYQMKPGDYVFEVKAIDSSGRTSETAFLPFRVTPPWYFSTVAKLAWAALLLMLIYMAILLLTKRRTRQLADETRRLEVMVRERTRALESANRQLNMAAHLDGLTEIPNRRKLDEYISQVWYQSLEQQRPMSLLVIDVDHFKWYNDEHGHVAGDELLKDLARLLSANLRRAEDLVARYGGEEFLIVLPGADITVARGMAELMRAETQRSDLGVTISVGIASAIPSPRTSVTHLVEQADSALYAAKAAGRNCVKGG